MDLTLGLQKTQLCSRNTLKHKEIRLREMTGTILSEELIKF